MPSITGLLTIGHGRSDRIELAGRLRSAGTDTLVDVRRYPGSRHNPDVARDALASWLPDAGFGYRWEEALGGRRTLGSDAESLDPWWTVDAFRAYAAHTRTEAFRAALAPLVRKAQSSTVVLMCSESVWWRCHRRLIADVATLRYDLRVTHLLPDSRTSRHEPADGARLRSDGVVVWDGPRTRAAVAEPPAGQQSPAD